MKEAVKAIDKLPPNNFYISNILSYVNFVASRQFVHRYFGPLFTVVGFCVVCPRHSKEGRSETTLFLNVSIKLHIWRNDVRISH